MTTLIVNAERRYTSSSLVSLDAFRAFLQLFWHCRLPSLKPLADLPIGIKPGAKLNQNSIEIYNETLLKSMTKHYPCHETSPLDLL